AYPIRIPMCLTRSACARAGPDAAAAAPPRSVMNSRPFIPRPRLWPPVTRHPDGRISRGDAKGTMAIAIGLLSSPRSGPHSGRFESLRTQIELLDLLAPL